MYKRRPTHQEHCRPPTPQDWLDCVLAGFLVWVTEQIEAAAGIPGASCLLDGVPAIAENGGGASVVVVFLTGFMAVSTSAPLVGAPGWLALLGGVVVGVAAMAAAGCTELRWGRGPWQSKN